MGAVSQQQGGWGPLSVLASSAGLQSQAGPCLPWWGLQGAGDPAGPVLATSSWDVQGRREEEAQAWAERSP